MNCRDAAAIERIGDEFVVALVTPVNVTEIDPQAFGIALGREPDDGAVLGDRLAQPARERVAAYRKRVERAAHEITRLSQDPVVEVYQEHLVEAPVQEPERLEVRLIGGRRHPSIEVAQLAKILVGEVRRHPGGDGSLEDAERVVDLTNVVDGERPDVVAAAAIADDDAFGLEPQQRFADRRATDGETIGEQLFVDALSRAETAGADFLPQQRVHLVGD